MVGHASGQECHVYLKSCQKPCIVSKNVYICLHPSAHQLSTLIFGNALFSLADHARHWYEREPLESFCDESQTTPKFKHFEKVFLAKFKKDETLSDVMCEVLNAKQQRGQSVTDYLSVVFC